MEVVLTIIGIITGMGALYAALKSSMKKEILDPLQKSILELSQADCKNFLIKFLNDKEHDLPQNEACIKRAYEVKDRAKELGVNSYIARKWRELMNEDW